MLQVCVHVKHVVVLVVLLCVINSVVVSVPSYSLFTCEFLVIPCNCSHYENGYFEVLSLHVQVDPSETVHHRRPRRLAVPSWLKEWRGVVEHGLRHAIVHDLFLINVTLDARSHRLAESVDVDRFHLRSVVHVWAVSSTSNTSHSILPSSFTRESSSCIIG